MVRHRFALQENVALLRRPYVQVEWNHCFHQPASDLSVSQKNDIISLLSGNGRQHNETGLGLRVHWTSVLVRRHSAEPPLSGKPFPGTRAMITLKHFQTRSSEAGNLMVAEAEG